LIDTGLASEIHLHGAVSFSATPRRHFLHTETYNGIQFDPKHGFSVWRSTCIDGLEEKDHVKLVEISVRRVRLPEGESPEISFSTQKASVSSSWKQKSSNAAFLAAPAKTVRGFPVHPEKTRPRWPNDSV
jgi:hypothetical protein